MVERARRGIRSWGYFIAVVLTLTLAFISMTINMLLQAL
jgi:hypothetical protein